MSNERTLTISQVVKKTGWSRSTIYKRAKDNEFPTPSQIRCMGSGRLINVWTIDEVELWMVGNPKKPSIAKRKALKERLISLLQHCKEKIKGIYLAAA